MKIINIINFHLCGFMGFLIMLPVLWIGCKEENRIDYFDKNAPAPKQVRDVAVRNTSGGAVLRYTLPDDKNLLYVQAVYEIQPGVVCETKSSYFKDSLVLEGFGNTRTYNVKLYSVGKNEKLSEPLTVEISPKTPPVHLATKNIRETFGGVIIDVENPAKVALAIVLLADTANVGYMSVLETFYSAGQKVMFSFRGLKTEPYEFAVYFRDKWNNYSDTILSRLTPWYEEEIKKDTWKEYPLPGDAAHLPAYNDYSLKHLWDEIYSGGTGNYHSIETLPLPQVITWDFGKTVNLCRFKLWPRRNLNNSKDDCWERGHPKVFQIWGSTSPNPSGSLDNSWIQLGKFECVKPSGDGPATQDDYDFAWAGIDFNIEPNDVNSDPTSVPVRFIRFRTMTTFRNMSVSPVDFHEISFWGINLDK